MAKKLSINLNGKHQKIKTVNENYIQNEIYYSNELTPDILSKIPLVIPNLTSYEFLDDRLVLKTPIITGDSVYEDSDISPSTRIDVINKYLKIIDRFSNLPIFLQINLMRLENFYLVKGELIHRGVLIVEDCKFNYPFTNEHLLRAISFFTLKIIHEDPALINFETYFKNLENEKKTVKEIIDDIKNIYIQDLFDEKKFTNKAPKESKKNRLAHLNFTFILSALLFLFFLVGSAVLISKASTNNVSEIPIVKIEEKKQNSSYILIDRSFSSKKNLLIIYKEWKLYEDDKLIQTDNSDMFTFLPEENKNYKVTFKVKDSDGTWSEEIVRYYTLESENSNDALNNLKLSGAKFNYEVFREGTASIDLTESSKDFFINNTYLNGKVNVLFYLKSKEDKKIKISVSGYNGSALEKDTSKQIFVQSGKWKKVNLSFDAKDVSRIKLQFEYDSGNVFLDNLSLSSSKPEN